MARKSFNFEGLLEKAEAQKHTATDEVKDNLSILPELRDLIPPLGEEEFAQLEENILQEGCREPLLLWEYEKGKYYILDGHNRYRVCQHHGLGFAYKVLDFPDREEAKTWMINNQLGRRNLTPSQQSYLRGKRYQVERSQGKRSDLTSPQNEEKLTTAQRLAKEYNVGRATIERDLKYAQGVDLLGYRRPEFKNQVLAGEGPLKKGQIQDLPNFQHEFLKKVKTLPDLRAVADWLREQKEGPKTPQPDPNENWEPLLRKIRAALIQQDPEQMETLIQELQRLKGEMRP